MASLAISVTTYHTMHGIIELLKNTEQHKKDIFKSCIEHYPETFTIDSTFPDIFSVYIFFPSLITIDSIL